MMKKAQILFLAACCLLFTGCEKEDSLPATNPVDSTGKGGNGGGGKVHSYLTGDGADVSTETTFGVVLMGGSTDVDEAMQWMIERSGGGDFVVIRTSRSDGYNDYIYSELGGVNSVETLVVDSRSKAKSSTVSETIRNAEALFIAGGDQSKYVDYWKDTPLEDAINYLVNTKNAPIGGTSAGLAILTNYYYAATNGSVYSDEALADPYDYYMAGLGSGFLEVPYLQNTISDTHYSERDRHGRHFTFMARLVQEFKVPFHEVQGIGVDERTAACVDENGLAKVFGYGDAYFIKGYGGSPEICQPETPLSWNQGKQAVKVYAVPATPQGANTFSLADWATGNGGSWQYWWSETGTFFEN